MKAIIYSISISKSVKGEWQTKEYASWEDHKYPDTGHIYPLLCNMPKTKIVCRSQDEVDLVFGSAAYQASWDSDDPVVERLVKKCKQITKELSSKERV